MTGVWGCDGRGLAVGAGEGRAQHGLRAGGPCDACGGRELGLPEGLVLWRRTVAQAHARRGEDGRAIAVAMHDDSLLYSKGV